MLVKSLSSMLDVNQVLRFENESFLPSLYVVQIRAMQKVLYSVKSLSGRISINLSKL